MKIVSLLAVGLLGVGCSTTTAPVVEESASVPVVKSEPMIEECETAIVTVTGNNPDGIGIFNEKGDSLVGNVPEGETMQGCLVDPPNDSLSPVDVVGVQLEDGSTAYFANQDITY
jgi:hypothetical protein